VPVRGRLNGYVKPGKIGFDVIEGGCAVKGRGMPPRKLPSLSLRRSHYYNGF